MRLILAYLFASVVAIYDPALGLLCLANVIPCCCCNACKSGVHPDTLTLTMAGITGTCFSSDPCSGFDASYELPLAEPCHTVSDFSGTWERAKWVTTDGPGICGGSFYADITIQWSKATGEREIFIQITTQPGSIDFVSNYRLYETSQSEPFDCQSFAAKVVPLLINSGFRCTGPASVTISA